MATARSLRSSRPMDTRPTDRSTGSMAITLERRRCSLRRVRRAEDIEVRPAGRDPPAPPPSIAENILSLFRRFFDDIGMTLGVRAVAGNARPTGENRMHWIDPAYLPETKGTVDRFLINQHGDADGLLLKDGKEVQSPPDMSKAILAALKPGDHRQGARRASARRRHGRRCLPRGRRCAPRSWIRGHRRRNAHTKGMTTTRSRNPSRTSPSMSKGSVKQVLHGPKGETRGALLEDGTIVRMPPHAADLLRDKLAPGHKLAARGQLDQRLGECG